MYSPLHGFGIAISGGDGGSNKNDVVTVRDAPFQETDIVDVTNNRQNNISDRESSLIVCDVVRAGPADGKLLPNDQIISVNGYQVANMEHSALKLIRESTDFVNLVVRRRKHSVLVFDAEPTKLTLQKTKKDEFGIVLGCRYYVKKIHQQSSIEKENLITEGDEIIKINETPIDRLSLIDAQKLVDKAKERLTLFVLPRHNNHQNYQEQLNISNNNNTNNRPSQGSINKNIINKTENIKDHSHQYHNHRPYLEKNIPIVVNDSSHKQHQNGGLFDNLHSKYSSTVPVNTQDLQSNYNAHIFNTTSSQYSQQEHNNRHQPSSIVQKNPVTLICSTATQTPLQQQKQHEIRGITNVPDIIANYKHDFNRPSSNLTRYVSFLTDTTSMGIRLAGGDKYGIFICEVQADSVAHKAGLLVADKIFSVNNVDFTGLTREEAVLCLMNMKIVQVNMIVSNLRHEYEQLLADVGGDSFYVRAHFSYNSPGDEDLPIRVNDIFHITDTLYNGQVGSWVATKVNASSGKTTGAIPNKAKAEQLAALAPSLDLLIKSKPSLKRKLRSRFSDKRSRSVSSLQLKEDALFASSTSKFPAYERVLLKAVTIIRPVVLFGALADIARDRLLKDWPERFELPRVDISSPTKARANVIKLQTIKNVIQRNRHCLLDITPAAVEQLNYAQCYPIVLYLKANDRRQIKDIRAKYGKLYQKSTRRLYESSERLELLYSYLFTAEIKLDTNNWYKQVKATIETQQEQPVWMCDDRPADKNLNSDEYFISTRHSYTGNSSPESDIVDSFKNITCFDDYNNQNNNNSNRNNLQRVASDPVMFPRTNGEMYQDNSTNRYKMHGYSPYLSNNHDENEDDDDCNEDDNSGFMQHSTMSLPNRSHSVLDVQMLNSKIAKSPINSLNMSSNSSTEYPHSRLKTIHDIEESTNTSDVNSFTNKYFTDRNQLINNIRSTSIQTDSNIFRSDSMPHVDENFLQRLYQRSGNQQQQQHQDQLQNLKNTRRPLLAPKLRNGTTVGGGSDSGTRLSLSDSGGSLSRRPQSEFNLNINSNQQPQANGYHNDSYPVMVKSRQYPPSSSSSSSLLLNQKHDLIDKSTMTNADKNSINIYATWNRPNRSVHQTANATSLFNNGTNGHSSKPRNQTGPFSTDSQMHQNGGGSSSELPSSATSSLMSDHYHPNENNNNSKNDANNNHHNLSLMTSNDPSYRIIRCTSLNTVGNGGNSHQDDENQVRLLLQQKMCSSKKHNHSNSNNSSVSMVKHKIRQPIINSNDDHNDNQFRSHSYTAATNAQQRHHPIPVSYQDQIEDWNQILNLKKPRVYNQNDYISQTTAPTHRRHINGINGNDVKNNSTSSSASLPVRNYTDQKCTDQRMYATNQDEDNVIGSARGIMDYYGGTLSCPKTGVSIIVPEGAIPHNIKQEIYFKVCQDGANIPTFNQKHGERLLSPIVMCGPHGIKFLKPVELLLPHCAGNDAQELALMLHGTNNVIPTDNRLTVSDTNSIGGKLTGINHVTSSNVSILVDHF
ncbi:unnamed protein product [Didymodactylos carnosus]|uniref:Tight junction protein ZO-1 n=1 Tax=Didymodactylos carnosus TaxID=1234261 RepID=A0A813TVJ2_9BILA|nr:unnamed protein product [Didymodactylos carnosus]CAF3604183.1 unnamed protein product [Didymodactylos carnosus]